MSLEVSKIQRLPHFLVNQIKAGEVIEGPTQVIKELIENSLDAKSTKINVSLLNSGLDLIRVEDNGFGIPPEDLNLALERHATSKLRQFEDLYDLNSFGFRGEALASIASVSKIKITSHCFETKTAALIEQTEERIEGPMPIPYRSPGTEINVENLFFNTPVRLKFAKSFNQELNRIKELMFQFSLANPNVHFSLKVDGKLKWQYQEQSTRLQLVKKWLNEIDVKENLLITAQQKFEDYEVEIFLLDPSFQTSKRFQYIFVDKRPIQDVRIKSALNNVSRQFGANSPLSYLIFLRPPKRAIDVNVDPQKSKVRFSDNNVVISLIANALKNCLKSTQASTQGPAEPNEYTGRSPQESSLTGYTRYIDNMLGPSKIEYFKLSERDILIKCNNKNFYLDLDDYIASSLASIRTLDWKGSIIPLLISRPIAIRPLSNTELSYLKNFHLEIQLVDNQLILRSWPEELASFDPSSVVKIILNHQLEDSEVRLLDTDYFISNFIEHNKIDDFCKQYIDQRWRDLREFSSQLPEY